VIGITGRSGAGKTSLLERLIPILEARGIAVGAAKHASHGFAADRPGKDSHRLYASGACAVALVSAEQTATFVRNAGPASIETALAALPDGLDLLLAEGFSWEPIPRIVVRGSGREPKPDDLAGGEVIAVVSVREYPEAAPARFERRTIEALVEGLLARLAPVESELDGEAALRQRRIA
jgi:molybdopterin-guanine dinucleotide biosynthesis protein B